MRLPARLFAKLIKARIAQVLNSAPEYSFLHCVDPAEVLHPSSVPPVSRERMQALVEISAPVIWIGGSEPLVHPGIGHFVRALAQSGHFVFLETDGTLLRRRIHEFQPLPELFLTVRLDGLRTSASALAVEGLRAARLSGFFTVVHSRVDGDFGSAQLSALRSFISEKEADGWMITAASGERDVASKAFEVRRQIPSWFWRRFSRHAELASQGHVQGRESRASSASAVESRQPEGCNESVRVA